MNCVRLIVVATFVIVATITLLTWRMDTQARRITQLECSLAAAWAHVDTLETELQRRQADAPH